MTKNAVRLSAMALAMAVTVWTWSPASAADVLPTVAPTVVAPMPVIAAPSPLWQGFYVGVHVGYGWGNFPVDLSIYSGAIHYNDFFADEFPTLDGGDGFLFGLQLGANMQRGNFVFGLETDMSRTKMNATGTFTTEPPNWTTWDIDTTLRYLGTVRARAGIAFGRTLIYGTGGLAWGITETTQATNWYDPAPAGEGGRTAGKNAHLGWTLGAGAEFMLGDSLSLRAEYLYVRLSAQNYALAGVVSPTNPAPYVETVGVGPITAHVLRFGANLHF
jgi:outer membrane immunogenic protein